jgi:hypothetical protein
LERKEREEKLAKLQPKRYMLVGGNPFRDYNGTTCITSIDVIAYANTAAEVKTITEEVFDYCGGVMLWIDRETGKPGEPT